MTRIPSGRGAGARGLPQISPTVPCHCLRVAPAKARAARSHLRPAAAGASPRGRPGVIRVAGAGGAGLDVVREVVAAAPLLLRPGGDVWLEVRLPWPESGRWQSRWDHDSDDHHDNDPGRPLPGPVTATANLKCVTGSLPRRTRSSGWPRPTETELAAALWPGPLADPSEARDMPRRGRTNEISHGMPLAARLAGPMIP